MDALRATISPTKLGICEMTQLRTSLMAGKSTSNFTNTSISISRKRSRQIMYIAPPKQSYLIDTTSITVEFCNLNFLTRSQYTVCVNVNLHTSKLLILQDDYQLQSLVEKITKKMQSKSRDCDSQVEELILIDAIQRLGLEYYFQDAMDCILKKHHVQFFTIMAEDDSNLHDVALSFRLLRQAGYNVPADIFYKFKDKDGEFKIELRGDMSGLMNLFEASHLSIPGEQILDDAAKFCKKSLKITTKYVGTQAEDKTIQKTLSNPFYKSLPRLSAKFDNFEGALNILHNYCAMPDWIYELKELARIDVIKARAMYKKEITQVTRWWKELCLAENLKLARSQPVKWHMWSLVVLPGPYMGELRTELTKAISFIYIIDDIYDVYGTLEELTLFTEAVDSWDYSNIKGLPDYMKMCLKALFDTTNDISDKLNVKHGRNPKKRLQKAWAELCNAFLVEAKWFESGNFPTTEEYLKNGIVSSGVYIVSAHVFSLLGESVYHKDTDLQNSEPGIVTSAARILRLWDDLGSSKDENQDGNDGSFIACYKSQYEDSSSESARKYVLQMISDSWKYLNQDCLSNSSYSAEFKTTFINLARMVPIMYSYDENHQLPSLNKYMKLWLHE